uniref:Uncharacterized protein n=1 Tax=Gadus morhua TaxID=8049 RepID=A0A8C5CDV8_GADMO
ELIYQHNDGSNAILFQNQILSFHPFFSLSLFSLTGRRYTHLQQRAVQSTSHTRVHENLADSQLAGGVSECVCAIACLYLLWKRERRRRCTELLAVILYNYIILYTIIYRAPGVANGNNHFLLHAAVHPGLHCRTVQDLCGFAMKSASCGWGLSLTVER